MFWDFSVRVWNSVIKGEVGRHDVPGRKENSERMMKGYVLNER